MGGRGGTSRIGKQKVTTNKIQKSIAYFIKKQTKVDINKYRDDFTSRFEAKDGALIYWKDVPKVEKQSILNLSTKYGGKLLFEDVGSWGKLIRLKKGG